MTDFQELSSHNESYGLKFLANTNTSKIFIFNSYVYHVIEETKSDSDAGWNDIL